MQQVHNSRALKSTTQKARENLEPKMPCFLAYFANENESVAAHK